jgi:hypothetical protein
MAGEYFKRTKLLFRLLLLLCGTGALQKSGLAGAPETRPAALPPSASRKVDFTTDVRPILEKSCFDCHGPVKAKGELQLDTLAHALKGGELGPVIVPGKSAESLMIQAVSGMKEDLVMPKKGDRLTAEQIGILRAWIDQGAIWPEAADSGKKHWAFIKPVRPRVPTVQNTSWARNPIDNFIAARLEREKLHPNAEASRETLLRRLSLDITGLPPAISEVEEFAENKSPDGYRSAIERLLASPHYGERWGRHWLDLARYADTNGYEKDKPRSIWPYRDWVISAFNRNMPFNQFTIEQLAGDLLPQPSRDQLVATGFLRNSMQNQEGGIEPEQFRVEALIDRMDTIGKSFLGLTINCCQCHNHKYDPFSQKEYFQLYAFLNNDDEAFLEVTDATDQKKREKILATVETIKAKAVTEDTNLVSKIASWKKSHAAPTTNWMILDPRDWQNFATKFEKEEDKSLLGGGDLQPGGVMRIWADTDATNITGFRLEALTNANLMYGGPGLIGKGSFIVKEFTVDAWARTNATVTNHIKFRRAVADREAPGFSITNAIDGKTDKGGWCPANTPEARNENHIALFQCDKPFGFPEGTSLEITIHQSFDAETKLECHMLGSLRVGLTTEAAPLAIDNLNAAQKAALQLPEDKLTPSQKRSLWEVFRSTDPSSEAINKKIAEAYADWPYPPTTMVLHRRAIPRKTHIFKRGDRLRPTEEVEPDVPAVLSPLAKDAPRNRLGLAQWIVSPENTTTARALVNRMWQEIFGQGLVTTPEDFGTRVQAPSHPELLDWLACEMMDSGWDMKHMLRLIFDSATYRQSSAVTPELYEKDAANQLLARGPRFRVEGEIVQDIALSVAGLLNSKVGGPSVYPPIPGSVGDTAYGGFHWPETRGEDRYRRGMYTFAKRSLPFPSLLTFDGLSGEVSCPRRMRSNTPLQALTTLNEKTFVEAAQAMAVRVLREGGSDNGHRAIYAFELATGRKPSPDELEKLLNFWNAQYNYFEERTAEAIKVALPDPTFLPPDTNLHKAAAWAMVSRAILNLDETITCE